MTDLEKRVIQLEKEVAELREAVGPKEYTINIAEDGIGAVFAGIIKALEDRGVRLVAQ